MSLFKRPLCESSSKPHLCIALYEEEILWPRTSSGFNNRDYFMCEYLKDGLFEKNPHTVSELKCAIREETEAIYKITLTESKLCIILSLFA
jgi:hypothetical protein